MKKFGKFLSLAISAAMLAGSLAGCGGSASSAAPASSAAAASEAAPAKAVTFTVTADVTGDRAPYVERFAELVKEKTGGRYEANVIAAGSLGTGADAAQRLILIFQAARAAGVIGGAQHLTVIAGIANVLGDDLRAV